ncbi:hypothetical protein [Bauldia sp.]|uniref:hypothetical protein n=1 Tax=Bauldia sp. TaxID=2575872 RepID=UPI003BAC6B1B
MVRTRHGALGYIAVALAASALVFSDDIAAQDTGEHLAGTWTMTDISGRSWNGARHTPDTIESIVLEISDHDGTTFAGTYSWRLSADNLDVDDGREVTMEAEEVVLGVRDFDGTYVMVDHPDTSVIRIRIVDENTLELMAYESGPHAAVSRMRFERQ